MSFLGIQGINPSSYRGLKVLGLISGARVQGFRFSDFGPSLSPGFLLSTRPTGPHHLAGELRGLRSRALNPKPETLNLKP